MDNREEVRKWVFKNQKITKIKGFTPFAIVKGLDIPIKEVCKYCTELVECNILDINYCYRCECGFSDVYKTIGSIPKVCEWCDTKIDPFNTTIEFAFRR